MQQDRQTLRELGKRYAEIAALPIQQERKALWRANNDLKPARPPVYMDQLPWHELAQAPEMRLVCQDPFLRQVEQRLREVLYRHDHFPCDMVVEPRIDLPRHISGLKFGQRIHARALAVDPRNDVQSHAYEDILSREEDLALLEEDQVVADLALDLRRQALLQDIFADILPVRLRGVMVMANIWDNLTQMRNQEDLLVDLIERPDFVRRSVIRLRDITMDAIRQLEHLGLLDNQMEYVHCTGAYTDNLESPGEGPVGARHVWGYGMSQIFSIVSPRMHEEFDIDLLKPMYEMFGLFYYGCCEPLHNKVDMLRKVKNIRKVSVSPWADVAVAAQALGRDYVLSFKAHPAYIANGRFEDEQIRRDLIKARQACEQTGTPCEFILKDVSAVQGRLDFLDRWHDLAMEVAMG